MLKKSHTLSTSVFIAAFYSSSFSHAAGTITFGEDKYISVGIGTISSYRSEENAAANGTDRSNDFTLNSARLLLSGSLNKYIKGMLKTERLSSDGSIEIIDANAQFEITPNFAIWAGRFLSPSDRANMSGPYYSMGGGYWSGVASRYGFNGGTFGRDDGVAIVGNTFEQRLSYSAGAFEADNIFRFTGIGAQSEKTGNKEKLMYAGRLQYDFFDLEPGYYASANHYGTKDILAIGIAGRYKKDGVISANSSTGDYTSYNVDFLFEKKDIGPGSVAFEAAFYKYDTDNVFLGEQGKAFSTGTSYIFNRKIGWGQIMPFVRYQQFNADGTTNANSLNSSNNTKTSRKEIGVNYVIAPYDAIITAVYGDTKVTGKQSINALNIALQLQF